MRISKRRYKKHLCIEMGISKERYKVPKGHNYRENRIVKERREFLLSLTKR
jgi:hypothetical protein